MQDLKATAIDVLAANPSLKEVFAAEDGNMFATEQAAHAHNASKGVNTAAVKPESFERSKLAKEIEAFLNPSQAKAEKPSAAAGEGTPAPSKASTKAKAEETK